MKGLEFENCIDWAADPDTTLITASLRCQCGRLIVGRFDDVSKYRFCPWCGRKIREWLPEYRREISIKEEEENVHRN